MKMLCVYVMGFYFALKKNETMKFARKWVGQGSIKPIEVTQAQKGRHHLFSLFMKILALNSYILFIVKLE